MNYCPKCGKERFCFSDFCYNCGFDFQSVEHLIKEEQNIKISNNHNIFEKLIKGFQLYNEIEKNHTIRKTSQTNFLINQEDIKNIHFSTGPSQTFAVINGTVWGCGSNIKGELVNDFTKDQLVFTPIQGLSNINHVIAGYRHAIALTNDGIVSIWGNNPYGGLLEDGKDMTYQQIIPPTHVMGLSNVVTIYSGNTHRFALKKDGTLWGWGNNGKGQLGTGNNSSRLAQVKLDNIVKLACGNAYTISLKSDGTIWSWGYSFSGSTGDETRNYLSPAKLINLNGVIDISAGEDQSVALTEDGDVWAWGEIYRPSHIGLRTSLPSKVLGVDNVQSITSGAKHNVALKKDGTVWAWGRNMYGQLGNGTQTDTDTPTQVIGLKNIVAIKSSCCSDHTIALDKEGDFWAWGYNKSGQLGNGKTNNTTIPIKMVFSK